MLQHRWMPLNRPDLGLINQLSEVVRRADLADAYAIPELRCGSTILIGCDYSGQHKASSYQALGICLADADNAREWSLKRQAIRGRLPDKRRFSYKKLNDRLLYRELPCFLEACSSIPGLLVVILIHNAIGTLFRADGNVLPIHLAAPSLDKWNPKVREKLLRIIHFTSLFLAGLSKPHQNVTWVTDEDDIAANPPALQELGSALGMISNQYLPHCLGDLRIATTAADNGSLEIEDFVAVSDLAAGTLAEVVTQYCKSGLVSSSDLLVPVFCDCSAKTLCIMDWLAHRRGALRKLYLTIDPVLNSKGLEVRQIEFHGASRTVVEPVFKVQKRKR